VKTDISQSTSGPERLSVATITATLEDMRKHGLSGGLPQEEAFFLLRQIGLLELQADAMTDCIGPREGQTFEERVEELGVSEVLCETLAAQLAEARTLLAEHINGHSGFRCNVRDFLSRTDRS
jgi:hypothetical protein